LRESRAAPAFSRTFGTRRFMKKDLNMKNEEQLKSTCPYCGSFAAQLYVCTNRRCANSSPKVGIGCTNPDVDDQGMPKCLYKYVYAVFCRTCNAKARIYSKQPIKDLQASGEIQVKSQGAVPPKDSALVYRGSAERCYNVKCTTMYGRRGYCDRGGLQVWVDGNYVARLQAHQSTDVCGKLIGLKGAPDSECDTCAWEATAINKFTDDLGCDYRLCDGNNPCPQGCICTYPPGARIGYCRPWYQPQKMTKQEATNQERKEYAIGAILAIVSTWDPKVLKDHAVEEMTSALKPDELETRFAQYRTLGNLNLLKSCGEHAKILLNMDQTDDLSTIYTTNLEFDSAAARIKIVVVKRGEKWAISDFRVDSQFFSK